MAATSFLIPPRLRFGEGVLSELGREAQPLGRRALVVTGPATAKLGRTGAAVDLLRGAGLAAQAFTGIAREPYVSDIDEGCRAAEALGADLIVGVGGGSALDAAKAIAAQLATGVPIADCEGSEKVRAALPVIAVPTTAGTGSEVTRFTVVTRPGKGGAQVKMLIASQLLIPRAALLDPSLLGSAPLSAAAAAGIDALTHAIEAYVSDVAQPITDDLALSAIRRLAPRVALAAHGQATPEDLDALMLGALEAGMAFSNASVALVHGMARPLGAFFDVPHGVANAMLLPEVVRFSQDAAPARYSRIAQALGESGEDAADGVGAICELCRLPAPRDFGIDAATLGASIGQMARDALRSGSPQHNPRQASVQEIEAIYVRALLGTGDGMAFAKRQGALE